MSTAANWSQRWTGSIRAICSDVMQLFEHEGITPGIRRAFVVYLASHNRPFHEVLFSTPLDIRLEYERTFVGMTTEPVTLERLLDTRARLQRELPAALDNAEREFLRTLARAEPDWSLLDIPHLEELPAVRWKLQNLQQLAISNTKKFDQMVSALDDRLQQLPRERQERAAPGGTLPKTERREPRRLSDVPEPEARSPKPARLPG